MSAQNSKGHATEKDQSLLFDKRALTRIYLVGAGPGDPSLITLKGARALKKAHVVVHDYLASPALLAQAPTTAERIYVGKKGFSAHVTQEEINELLVAKAKELEKRGGGVLVRLKGGDPFVFGRGGEEALALKKAGFAYAVVPGVTSGVAAPAFAGIPVTHRGVSSSVMFVTGNEDPLKPASALNWKGIARAADTLCFYMGIRNLPEIASQLIAQGRRAETPVALVRWGTTARQAVLSGTLANIAQRAQEASFQAPAIIVVGEVVNLREKLNWFDAGPLANTVIAVTRPGAQRSALSMRLESLGAEVVELPTISIAPPPSYQALDCAIKDINRYHYIVFTSANGVFAFFERLKKAGFDARALHGLRTASIGSATAAALESFGLMADVVPSEFRAEALVSALFDDGLSSADTVLLPRALKAREVLPASLRAQGVEVDVVPAYQTTLPPLSSVQTGFELLQSGGIDALTFTSSSTVDNFVKLLQAYQVLSPTEQSYEELLHQVCKKVAFYSIGPITTATARKAGISIEAQASIYTIDGLVRALAKARTVHTNESERIL